MNIINKVWNFWDKTTGRLTTIIGGLAVIIGGIVFFINIFSHSCPKTELEEVIK